MCLVDDDDNRATLNAPSRAMLRRCRPITFAMISRALNSKATPLRHIRSNRSSLETKDEMLSVNAGAFDLKTQSKEDELRMPLMRDIRTGSTRPRLSRHPIWWCPSTPATPNPSGRHTPARSVKRASTRRTLAVDRRASPQCQLWPLLPRSGLWTDRSFDDPTSRNMGSEGGKSKTADRRAQLRSLNLAGRLKQRDEVRFNKRRLRQGARRGRLRSVDQRARESWRRAFRQTRDTPVASKRIILVL